MQPLTDFFNTAAAGLGHILVEALPEDVVVTFELTGDGGGCWTVRRFGPRVTVVADDTPGRFETATGQHAQPDCRLVCSASDFQKLLSGELSSREGFLEGRLKVEGDVGLVLRLEKVIVRRSRAGAAQSGG